MAARRIGISLLGIRMRLTLVVVGLALLLVACGPSREDCVRACDNIADLHAGRHVIRKKAGDISEEERAEMEARFAKSRREKQGDEIDACVEKCVETSTKKRVKCLIEAKRISDAFDCEKEPR